MLIFLAGCSGTGIRQSRRPAVVRQIVRSVKSWDGEILPAYPQGQPEVTILRIKVPPGVRLDMHKHPVINAGILTKGQLTVVRDDGKTLLLKAGDPIVEIVNRAHYGINFGKKPAEIIVWYAGVENEPVSIRELE